MWRLYRINTQRDHVQSLTHKKHFIFKPIHNWTTFNFFISIFLQQFSHSILKLIAICNTWQYLPCIFFSGVKNLIKAHNLLENLCCYFRFVFPSLPQPVPTCKCCARMEINRRWRQTPHATWNKNMGDLRPTMKLQLHIYHCHLYKYCPCVGVWTKQDRH